MVDLYLKITNAFRKEFEIKWNEILNLLPYEQVQLLAGNRLRPQICLWGYLGTFPNLHENAYNVSYIASISVCIEMIHKASLLLDDWIDGDLERHGKPAFHTEHSEQETVMFALNLIGLSLSRMKNIFPKEIKLPNYYSLCLDTLIDTIYSMAKGAFMELSLNEEKIYNSEIISEISMLETSAIIKNSMLLGYYSNLKGCEENKKIVESFKYIGNQCGYLFQAMNDLEAYSNPQKLFEHKGILNSDIKNKKKNMAIATLYNLASERDKKHLIQDPENNVFFLMKKYHIYEIYHHQLEDVYKKIILRVSDLTGEISIEWSNSFQLFLENIKTYGEERLKK